MENNEEEGMTKYSVVLDDEKVKTADSAQKCPQCGAVVDKSTPNYCENCGTCPWEKK